LVGGEADYRRGDYEPSLSGALCRVVRPGFTCADVGAHHGYFSLLLAQTVGSEGRVIAFEASPANARVLRRNVALNRLTGRVDVVEAVVADGAQTTYRLWAARSGGADREWTLSEEFAAREDATPVDREPRIAPATTLDEALRGRPPDLLKIDVEGAEALVLAGAVGILREARPSIVLEYHGELGWPAIECLQEAGYVFEEVDGTPLELREPSDVPYHLVAVPRAHTSE
jgi:FkbM family methyltransferase